jgi:F-type H+-transporting ATPase subunit gamma
MGKTREIKKRIKAVGNIRRITKTMQMIATSKFAKAQQISLATKPYTETVFQLVTEIAAQLKDEPHPLLDSGKGPRPGKELTLIITSDRGLCGPYNGAVLRTAMHLARSNPAAKAGEIQLVGRKGASFLKFSGIAVAKQHTQFGDKPTYDNVRALAEDYTARFISGELSVVRVIYTKYISAGRQAPTVLQLLPFQTENAAASAREQAPAQGANLVFEFIPSAKELLDHLLPAAVKALLFQAFNDAVVSEHVARMVAMKSATDNAGKQGKRLTRDFNRARQTQITTELTEIVSGAAALA